MHLDRRTLVRSAVCSCLIASIEPLTVLSQSAPPSEVDVIATLLQAQCPEGGKHPVLIARERFSTGPMPVLETQPTPIQKATHQVELPYLLPPAERMAEARELAAAYNRSLDQPSQPLPDSAAFSFPHRILSDAVVSQFEDLYPGGNVYSAELEVKRRSVSSRYRIFFDGSTTLWRVSRVAFASGGTLAVVGLRSSGGSCWSERWEAMERFGGAWHGLNWGGSLLTCA